MIEARNPVSLCGRRAQDAVEDFVFRDGGSAAHLAGSLIAFDLPDFDDEDFDLDFLAAISRRRS